ncbi:hypothetical protein LC609_33370 [Nostoc sp. XA013]|nr:hypothetical protein [Nostoc sp. XA013]
MIKLQDFHPWIDIARIDRLMENTCRDAITNPRSQYLFMQRFVHYSRTYSYIVPALASKIGSSMLFQQTGCSTLECGERSMDIAAKVFAASIEEFRDPRTGVSHRTLSYALLDKLAQYADLSTPEIHQIASLGTWLDDFVQQVEAGYDADPTNLCSLIEAMGFHAATETIGGHEFSIINSVIFSGQRSERFGQFIKSTKVRFPEGTVSPWYWIVIHGTVNTAGVEADHSDDAINALNLAVQYTSVPEEQIIAWAGKGVAKFAHVQETFFQRLQDELCTILGTANHNYYPTLV